MAAALILNACGSSASAPTFSYRTGSSPSALASPSAAATAESSAAANAEATTASFSPSAEATAVSSASASAEASAGASAPPTSGPSAAPIGVPPTGTAIYLSEWSVGLPTSMLAGQVNFAITNIGTIRHELLVFKTQLPPSAVPVDKNGNIVEDGPGVTLVSRGDKIDPGKTQTRVVDLTQPGTYLFVCNLPGHFRQGMFRAVTVTPPSAEQTYIAAGLSEWHIAAPAAIRAGTVNLEAANFGTIQHELLVFKSDLPPSAYPLDKNGNIVEDGRGINLVSDGDNIDPGKTQTRTVDLTQPGSYLFVCNIPGHFKAGMFSELTVTP
jgi:uncharacterized cupredoxin-like copper-binding protein